MTQSLCDEFVNILGSSPDLRVKGPEPLEGCSDSGNIIAVTVEPRQPSRTSVTLPLVQGLQSCSEYLTPLRGTSRSSSSSLAGFFEPL